MCMNCGCGQPNERHGNDANITLADLQRAGDVNDQSVLESAQNILAAARQVDRGGGTSGAQAEEGLAKPAGSQPAPAAPRGTPGTES